MLSFYCYQKRRLLLRREVVLGSLLDTCAPHGGSFLVEGGTEDKRWPNPETRSPDFLMSLREKEILFDWLH